MMRPSHPGLANYSDNDLTGDTQKIRVAAVGCGPRGRCHISAMLASKAVNVVGVCDLNPRRAAAAADEFRIGAHYQNLADMVREQKPDLLDIITPPTIRVDIVEAASNAGVTRILIEKPIALKPSEAQQLVELGREVFIGVNTQYSWMPHWQQLWKVIADGGLGEIETIRCSTRCDILDQGPHVMDLAMRVAKLGGLSEPAWVLAATSGVERIGAVPLPRDVCSVFGLGRARLHCLHGSVAPTVPGEDDFYYHIQVEVIGTGGRLWVSPNRGWKLWREGTFESGDTDWLRDDRLAQAALFQELRDRILAGTERQFPTRLEVAARMSDLIFASYASAIRQCVVQLPCTLEDSVVAALGEREESAP